MTAFDIGGRKIGDGAPCFLIAEAGINHNGDLALAHRLIDAAVRAGADAVKFQTFDSGKLAAVSAAKAAYQKRATGGGESQLDMLRRLELKPDDFAALNLHCRTAGILFLSTPFEEGSADFLDQLGVAAFKLPSGEITNLPFLRHVAAKGRPLILSTGMSCLGEVETALDAIRAAGDPPLALLHCTTAYPADPTQINLRAMATLRAAFGVAVGFSDHSEGIAIPLAAVALGAAIVEKHFTLDRSLPGPDHAASLEPDELGTLVAGIRTVEQALGDGIKRPQPDERDALRVARKSVVAARDLEVGTVLTPDVLAVMRPGTGIAPSELERVVGRACRRAVAQGTPLTWDLLS